MVNRDYSVLMSVYKKDYPPYVRAAVDSMLYQTEAPAEIVIVCDGPLGEELDSTINEYRKLNNATGFKVIQLSQNQGLGIALSKGLKACSCELIARMDSDDISAGNRCALQLDYFVKHPQTDVLSGTLAEFEGAACSQKEVVVDSYKKLPENDMELKQYMRSRNPINHPCVMFRKTKVEEAGGYQHCPLFEDYDLWLRMAHKGAVFANLTDILLYMRTNHMYERRGGFSYAKAVINFRKKMYQNRWINGREFIVSTAIRVAVSLLPSKMRRKIYEAGLREH